MACHWTQQQGSSKYQGLRGAGQPETCITYNYHIALVILKHLRWDVKMFIKPLSWPYFRWVGHIDQNINNPGGINFHSPSLPNTGQQAAQ